MRDGDNTWNRNSFNYLNFYHVRHNYSLTMNNPHWNANGFILGFKRKPNKTNRITLTFTKLNS